MKPSTSTVLFRTAILVLLVTLVESDDYLTDPNYGTELLQGLSLLAQGAIAVKQTFRFIKRGKTSTALTLMSALVGDMPAITNLFNTEKPYEKQLEGVEKRLAEVEKKIGGVSDQIYDLETALADEIDCASHALRTETRLTHIVSFFTGIDAAANELHTLISTKTEYDLAKELIKFISSFDSREYGSCIFSGFNSAFVTLAPLVDELITRGRNNYDGSRWSVSTMIYSTHVTILNYLHKQITILEIAYIFLARVAGTLVDSALTKLSIERYLTLEQFNITYHNTYKKLNDEDCAQRVKLDSLQKDKIVSMKFFLQEIWVDSPMLNRNQEKGRPGVWDCTMFSNIVVPNRNCTGTIIKCEQGALIDKCGYDVIYQAPRVDGIYNAVGLDAVQRWLSKNAPHVNVHDVKCRAPTMFPNWERIAEGLQAYAPSFSGGYYELCKCVCNQHQDRLTVRRFYVRKIEAPIGHVITGVRFIENDRTIFLQIESAQLLPYGTVNETEWQPLPEKLEDKDYITFDYFKRTAVLNGLAPPKKDQFVTAISFEPHNMGVRFRSYTRKVHSFENGTLGDELHETPINETDISPQTVREFWDLAPKLSDEGLLMKVTEPLGVMFGMSSSADAKQTCIPYFDGSDIAFDLRVPLTDIRFLHYTNHAKYAGYIRPLLSSIDYNYFHFLQ